MNNNGNISEFGTPKSECLFRQLVDTLFRIKNHDSPPGDDVLEELPALKMEYMIDDYERLKYRKFQSSA